jgi:hypothetical protein
MKAIWCDRQLSDTTYPAERIIYCGRDRGTRRGNADWRRHGWGFRHCGRVGAACRDKHQPAPRSGATGVLQRCVVAQLGRGRGRGVFERDTFYIRLVPRGAAQTATPEPQWYLRVWCAGSGSTTKAFELRRKTAPTWIDGEKANV